MKKTVLAVLLCVSLMVISVSYAEEPSSVPTSELQQQIELAKEELISRQVEESGRILVTEDKGVKIFFDGFTKDIMNQEHIRFIIMNNSSETLPVVVSIEQLYIENWDVLTNGYLQTLDPGKNGVGEAWIKWEQCVTATEETASKIDVKFSLSVDKGDYEWEKIHETELITFYIK